MTTLKVGVASYEETKACTIAVALGERRIALDEPKGGSPRRSPSPWRYRRATAICCGSSRPAEWRSVGPV
jgi:hypothetical protein